MNAKRLPFLSLASQICAASLLVVTTPLSAQTTVAETETKPGEKVIMLSPYEVNTTSDKGYATTAGQGGTRINMPVMDSAMSITSINKELLEDMGFINLSDSLHFVSGMGTSRAFADGGYTFRGNQNNGSNFRDGVPEQNTIGGTEVVDTSLVDRLEVIKGPAGVLFGSMGIGGTVNRVSKMPLPTDIEQLKFSYNTVDLLRGDIDVSRKLITSKDGDTLSARLAAGYQKGKWFDGSRNDRIIFNPSIVYSDAHENRLWLYFAFQQATVGQSLTIPVDRLGNLFPGLDQHSPGHKDDRRTSFRRSYEMGYSKNFTIFGAESSIRFLGRFIDYYQIRKTPGVGTDQVYDPSGAFIGTNDTVVWSEVNVGRLDYLYLRNGDSRANYLGGTASIDFSSTFDVLNSHHRFFVYAQQTDERTTTWEIFTQPVGSTGPNPYLIAGIQHWPVLGIPANWGELNMQREAAGSFTPSADSAGTNSVTAVAAQDNVSFLNNRLIFVAGVRYDSLQTTTRDFLNVSSPGNPRTTATSAQAWSQKYGAVVKPLPDLAVYYNHADTFTPVYSLDTNPISPTLGQKFPDTKGIVDEFGVRVDMFNSRLVGSIVYYKSSVTNQLISVFPPIPTVANDSYLQPIGTITNKGWEFDLAAQPIKAVTLIASASITNPRLANGRPQTGVPTRTLAYFVKYSFLDGALKGLSIAGGYQFATNRKVSNAPVVRLPTYHMSNLNLIYVRSNWRFQVNCDNVFDQKEATGFIATNRVSLYPRRNFNSSLTWSY